MKTMLVPVDFSDTSNNAVTYAVEWAKAYGYERILLLKALYNSVFDNVIPAAGFMSVSDEYINSEREEADAKLKELGKVVMRQVAPDNIKVTLCISELPLVRAVMGIVRDEHAELVVVGSDNVNYSSNSFVGGNVITIAKISPVRVLIVPSHFIYQPVCEAVVPVNFGTVETLGKIEQHAAASPHFKPKKLLVLNIDAKEKYLKPDETFAKAEKTLHEYLQSFPHELYYSNNKNVIEGLLEFSDKQGVQLIIALPGKHSFLYSLTHASVSEAIYRNAKHPVLILK